MAIITLSTAPTCLIIDLYFDTTEKRINRYGNTKPNKKFLDRRRKWFEFEPLWLSGFVGLRATALTHIFKWSSSSAPLVRPIFTGLYSLRSCVAPFSCSFLILSCLWNTLLLAISFIMSWEETECDGDGSAIDVVGAKVVGCWWDCVSTRCSALQFGLKL